jgi:hypothetical protein
MQTKALFKGLGGVDLFAIWCLEFVVLDANIVVESSLSQFSKRASFLKKTKALPLKQGPGMRNGVAPTVHRRNVP